MTIWLNGQLSENGFLDASSAGVTLGWGVFTTIGIRGGKPLFLQRHFERLQRDARAAEIDYEFSFEAIQAGVNAILAANAVSDGLARLTLTRRGDGRWNQSEGADLSIMAHETVVSTAKLRVQLSPYRVENRRPLVGIKTTSYLPYIWAWNEARKAGFDEAILRDGKEFLSEGARSNLFWVKEGALYTPFLETGCLQGLGRELVLEWALENEVKVYEGWYGSEVVLDADEVFLISAAAGPRGVVGWFGEEGEVLRNWEVGSEVGERLREWWGEL